MLIRSLFNSARTLYRDSFSSIIARTDIGRVGRDQDGAVAQLGERMNGIHEVRGSIPLGSTNTKSLSATE